MAQLEEVEGIVLYRRKHRERDFLVKIFTKKVSKIIYFVRGSKRSQGELYQAIQPFTIATFIADIRSNGLSFLRGAKNIEPKRDLQLDIFNNAYATYLSALADAAIEDHTPNYKMYDLLIEGLHLIDEGYENEVISYILEVKFLEFFGVMPILRSCCVCGKAMVTFDYSDKFHGILCLEHFIENSRRLHVDPKAVHLIRLFAVIQMDRIGEISIKESTQEEIRRLIDHIYDQLVGLRLKSKKFIDNLYKWEDTLKKDN